MTREEAIKTIQMAKSEVEWSYPMDYQVAFDMAIKALEQEPITDRIEYGTDGNAYKISISNGKEFKQEPKTGRWIKRESEIVLFECSVCKEGYIDQPTCMGKPMFKYCPSCGAKMQEE